MRAGPDPGDNAHMVRVGHVDHLEPPRGLDGGHHILGQLAGVMQHDAHLVMPLRAMPQRIRRQNARIAMRQVRQAQMHLAQRPAHGGKSHIRHELGLRRDHQHPRAPDPGLVALGPRLLVAPPHDVGERPHRKQIAFPRPRPFHRTPGDERHHFRRQPVAEIGLAVPEIEPQRFVHSPDPLVLPGAPAIWLIACRTSCSLSLSRARLNSAASCSRLLYVLHEKAKPAATPIPIAGSNTLKDDADQPVTQMIPAQAANATPNRTTNAAMTSLPSWLVPILLS